MGFRSCSTLIAAKNFAYAPSDGFMELMDRKAGVIFSALSVEAFINDVEAFMTIGRKSWGDERVDALSEILPDLERDRVQLKTKVQLFYYILTGKRIEKGNEPYQSFALLIDLRNRLVHGRPPMMHFVDSSAQCMPTDRKFVERLIAAGAGSESFSKAPDWEAIAWSQNCSKWAFGAARNLISHLIMAFPSDNLKKLFKVSFEPLDIHDRS